MTEHQIIARLDNLDEAAKTFLSTVDRCRIFAFYGPMGSGKTTFIRSICQLLGCRQHVSSPTFSLIHEYHAEELNKRIFHIDLYRLQHLEEAINIGIDDYLNDTENIIFIEWPALIEALLPSDTVRVYMEPVSETVRIVRIIMHHE